MTAYIEKLLERFIVEKDQKKYRDTPDDPRALAAGFEEEGLPDLERAVRRLAFMLKEERPVVYPDEKIVLLRTRTTVPEIFTEREYEEIKKEHYIHEQGKVCNINPSYGMLIDAGFDKKREEIREALGEQEISQEKKEYLEALMTVLDLIEEFAGRYRDEAERVGNIEAARVFERIPSKGAENFREALQFLRLIHYCLWCSFNYHNTFGRFDQYMYIPILKKI